MSHLILSGILKRGGKNDPVEVREVQRLLIKAGFDLETDGKFGMHTEAAVVKFQEREGLHADGIVGPITWSALNPYGATIENHRRSMTMSGTMDRAIFYSEQDMGETESDGPNDSPLIRKMLAKVGINYPAPYCMAAVYWWVSKAFEFNHFDEDLKQIPRTAGVLDFWNRCPKSWRVDKSAGKRGDIAIYSWGGGRGHTGLVTGYTSGHYLLNEGNTNSAGSRDGEGFFRKQRSKYNDPKLLGFIRVPDPGAGVPS